MPTGSRIATSPRRSTDEGQVGPGRFLVWVGVPLSLALPLLGAAQVAIWLDESATLWYTDLPPERFADTVVNRQDAVHATYYVLVRAWRDVLGDSVFVARSLSVIAVAVAVAGIIVLARRLDGFWTGLWSGVALALLPFVADIGMQARSMAMSMAIATWATVALHSALRARADRHRRAWVLYGASLLASAYVFLFSLLIVAAHAASIAWLRPRGRPWRPFLMVVSAVAAMSLPLVAVAYGQRGQVSWISVGADTFLAAPFVWTSSRLAGLTLWLLVGLGILISLRTRQTSWTLHLRASTVLGVAVPWLALPTGVLLLASIITPIYDERYVAFCAPALALLVGWAITRVKPRLLAGALGVLALLLALPAHALNEDGRDGWGAKRAAILTGLQPGDGLVAEPAVYRRMAVVDPLPGLSILQGPIGSTADDALSTTRLALVDRIWVMTRNADSRDDEVKASLLRAGFHVKQEFPPPARVSLYVRD